MFGSGRVIDPRASLLPPDVQAATLFRSWYGRYSPAPSEEEEGFLCYQWSAALLANTQHYLPPGSLKAYRSALIELAAEPTQLGSLGERSGSVVMERHDGSLVAVKLGLWRIISQDFPRFSVSELAALIPGEPDAALAAGCHGHTNPNLHQSGSSQDVLTGDRREEEAQQNALDDKAESLARFIADRMGLPPTPVGGSIPEPFSQGDSPADRRGDDGADAASAPLLSGQETGSPQALQVLRRLTRWLLGGQRYRAVQAFRNGLPTALMTALDVLQTHRIDIYNHLHGGGQPLLQRNRLQAARLYPALLNVLIEDEVVSASIDRAAPLNEVLMRRYGISPGTLRALQGKRRSDIDPDQQLRLLPLSRNRTTSYWDNRQKKLEGGGLLRALGVLPVAWLPQDREGWRGLVQVVQALVSAGREVTLPLLRPFGPDWQEGATRIERSDTIRNIDDCRNGLIAHLIMPAFCAALPGWTFREKASPSAQEAVRALLARLLDRRPLPVQIEISARWHRLLPHLISLTKPSRSLTWLPLTNPWHGPGGIEILPLTHSTALDEEGKALNHCVGMYDGSCAYSRTHIVSLRGPDGKRCSTAEISLNDKGRPRLVQHQGPHNSPPGTDAHGALLAYLDGLETGRLPLNMEALEEGLRERQQQRRLLRDTAIRFNGCEFDCTDPGLMERLYALYRPLLPHGLRGRDWGDFLERSGLGRLVAEERDRGAGAVIVQRYAADLIATARLRVDQQERDSAENCLAYAESLLADPRAPWAQAADTLILRAGLAQVRGVAAAQAEALERRWGGAEGSRGPAASGASGTAGGATRESAGGSAGGVTGGATGGRAGRQDRAGWGADAGPPRFETAFAQAWALLEAPAVASLPPQQVSARQQWHEDRAACWRSLGDTARALAAQADAVAEADALVRQAVTRDHDDALQQATRLVLVLAEEQSQIGQIDAARRTLQQGLALSRHIAALPPGVIDEEDSPEALAPPVRDPFDDPDDIFADDFEDGTDSAVARPEREMARLYRALFELEHKAGRPFAALAALWRHHAVTSSWRQGWNPLRRTLRDYYAWRRGLVAEPLEEALGL